ncbi:MAG: hypothetical protein ACE363_13975 [Alphaproteobacteria bacterium]
MIRRLLYILVLMTPVSAVAQSFEDALNLYTEGNFYAAADMAEALETVDGDALAARALLAEAAYQAEGADADAALARALDISERAVAANPSHFEALLQRVIALGYKSRQMGSWPAHNAGLGHETRDLIERAIAADPNQAWGWVVKGGWTAEVLDGGGLVARMIYGVSRKAVDESYERAIALDPHNPILHIEYARALLRLSIRRHMADAAQLLERAHALTARDALERLIKQQGETLRTALKSGDRKRIKQVFRATDPFAKQ